MSSMTAGQVPMTPQALQGMAQSAALGAGLTPQQVPVFLSLIHQESGWNPDALSPVGAQGLGQLMPATARSLGVSNPRDPVQNLRGSAQYFKQQIDAFGGNVDLALAAYNAGPAAVRKYGGVPPYAETQAYVKNILNNATPQPGGPYEPPTGGAAGGDTGGSPGGLPSGDHKEPYIGDVLIGKEGQPYPPGTISNNQSVITPSQLGAIASPALRGAALSSQLQRIGGGWGDVTNALKNLGHTPGAVLSSLNMSTPTVRIPTPAERQSVQNQQQNFSFKTPSNTPLTKGAAGAVALAREYLGTPYVWGGESAKGFDCSGLLQYVYAKQGINIPRTTYDQFKVGARVPIGKLQPGDAVFFKGSDSRDGLPGHVGMYIGNGQIIQAPHTGATVEITKLSDMSDYMGARRFGAFKA